MGLYGKDTLKVAVGEYVFEDRTWIFPWYNSIEIPNFHSIVPPGTPFTIYIQRHSNPAWIEVSPLTINPSTATYEYFIETRPKGGGIYNYGSLYIFYYGNDVSDAPGVKITF